MKANNRVQCCFGLHWFSFSELKQFKHFQKEQTATSMNDLSFAKIKIKNCFPPPLQIHHTTAMTSCLAPLRGWITISWFPGQTETNDNLPGGVQPLDYYLIYNKAQYNFKIANIHSKVIFVQAIIHITIV